jgi:glycosyltransferase involved in cell wall biosynthesis
MPKISCIMPVYNTVKYLDECIQSILNQSFTDFEFIISDDGSSDWSKELIKNYAELDSRITFLDNKKNRWIIDNLNDCLNISKWDYIAIMESDDISNIHRFKKQIQIFEQDENLYLLWTKWNFINSESEIIWKYDPKVVLTNMMNVMFFTPWIMFRKQVIKKIWLFKAWYVWDINFFYTVYFNKLKCKVINDSLVNKRMFPESTLNSNLFKIQIELLKLRFHTIKEYNLWIKYYFLSINRVLLSYSIYITKKIWVHKFLSYYYHKYYIR